MSALVAKIKREPVAFWGGLAGAALAVLAFFGLVDEQTIGLITVVLAAVGIPVVRQQVTPVTQPTADDAGVGELREILILAAGIFLGLLVFYLLAAHTTAF